jgi:hypothetical protein
MVRTENGLRDRNRDPIDAEEETPGLVAGSNVLKKRRYAFLRRASTFCPH